MAKIFSTLQYAASCSAGYDIPSTGPLLNALVHFPSYVFHAAHAEGVHADIADQANLLP